MNNQFIQPLETRMFLSTDLVGHDLELPSAPEPQAAVQQTLAHAPRVYAAAAKAKIPTVLGVYRGTAKTPYGKQAITLRITSQQRNGRIAGVLTHPNHSWVSLQVAGTVYSNGSVKFTFAGADTDGWATGSGSGTVSANGKTITAKFTETEAGTRFKGTLSLRR